MSSLEKAREALKIKREQNAKAMDQSIQNHNIKSENVDPIVSEIYEGFQRLKDHIDFLSDLLGKYSNLFTGFFGEPTDSTGKLIFDIFQLYIMQDSREKLESFDDIFKMCVEIFDSSKDSYEILKRYIPFLPSISEIEEYRQKFFVDFEEDLLNLNNLPDIIQNYKSENEIISKDKIYASLAVDALFFKPNVKVKTDGTTSGFTQEIEISKKQFNSFSKDIENFSKFIQENWHLIVRAGFVFQLNPLKNEYKSIILHIIPHSNGKSNSNIINTLFKIKNILHNYRIEIVCFSFDGDNSYRVLNQTFFQSYFNRLIKNNFIPEGRILCLRKNPDF